MDDPEDEYDPGMSGVMGMPYVLKGAVEGEGRLVRIESVKTDDGGGLASSTAS